MPIVKIYRRRASRSRTSVSIIRINVRVPERAMGDLRAQIAAVKTGERRFMEMIEKYGHEPSARRIRSIMDQSEKRARGASAKFPTASTKPSRSWTTTASPSASIFRSESGSRSPATR